MAERLPGAARDSVAVPGPNDGAVEQESGADALRLAAGLRRREVVGDALFFATVFTLTFAKVRWALGGGDFSFSDVTASLFLVSFACSRLQRRDWRFPRTSAVLTLFYGAFALVYLVGFFGLETTAERSLFAEGLAKFALHYAFLVAAVAHLSGRSERFYWGTLGCFLAGIAANAVYGLAQLAVAQASGGNLDRAVLAPVGAYHGDAVNLFGTVGDLDVYRTNALTVNPNHLGIMLVLPLLVLLPIYLRLDRLHRLRVPLAALLVFLFLVELTTLSRSGLLGIAVGIAVLALPYRRLLLSPRLLAPLIVLAAVVALVVAQRAGLLEAVFQARATLTARVRLEIWSHLPTILDSDPLFGLGLGTFPAYYEFATGQAEIGPHSYYVALLSETGLVGTALSLVYLGYVFRRLTDLRGLGRRLARAGDRAAARVRPLAWGLTAALVGTLAANAFLVTVPLFYFFGFAMLALAAPAVFAQRPGSSSSLAASREDEEAARAASDALRRVAQQRSTGGHARRLA